MQKYIPEEPIDHDADFPEFAVREIHTFRVDHVKKRFKLLLPLTQEIDLLVQDLEELARQRETQHLVDEADRLDQERQEHLKRAPSRPQLTAAQKESERMNRERDDLENRFPEEKEAFDQEDKMHSAHVQVYAWDEPLKLLNRKKVNPDKDLAKRDEELYAELKELGAFRSIATGTSMEKVRSMLRGLRSEQPHFSSVVDLIDGQVSIALELGQPLRLPAILLAGPPGVGKTHFSLQLAKAMERPIHRHSFDSAHTRDSLMGSDRHWANTEAGLVFQSVCLSDRADPMVLLDEIDKSSTHRGDSSIASLHSLLEPVTAKSLTDISAGMQFDASLVFWVATANDLSLLAGPILSRFRVFHIQPPTAEQAIVLAQTVATSVHARYAGFDTPSRRVITQLAHLTPREQIEALEQTYANALLSGRKHLLCRDLPIDLQIEGASCAIHAQLLH